MKYYKLPLLIGIALSTSPAFAADGPVPVRAGVVTQQAIPTARAFIGTVEPARRSTIGSPVSGRVENVFAEEGDAVDPAGTKKGRIIQLELRMVEIELAAAIAERDAAFHELDELLKGPRKEVIDRLEAEVRRAQVRLDSETTRLERIQLLFDKDSAGQGDLDQVRAAREAAMQTQVIASLLHEEARLGTRPEKIAQARARLAGAEETVRQFQSRLEDHTIHAPFAGYVVSRAIERGAWIQQGDPVAEIIEVDPVEIRVSVPESLVARIRPDERVQVHVDAATDEDGRPGLFQGTVHRIIPIADTRTRSFPVRLRLHNSTVNGQPVIRPGMLSRVMLPLGTVQDALLVPRDALVLDGRDTFLYVLSADLTASRVNVRVGVADDDRVQVTPVGSHTLNAGSRVVTEGNERLKAGQTVVVLD